MTQEVLPGALPELGGSHADLNATVLFDVRVLGWRSTGAGTVAALQEVFGLDLDTATQLVSRVPAAVKRGVSSSEAQTFMRALQGVGAHVVLVRAGGPVTIDAPNPALANTNARYIGPDSQPIATPATASRAPAPPPPTPASAPAWSGSGSLAAAPRATGQTYRGPSPAPRTHQPASRPVTPPTAASPGLDLMGNDGRKRSASGRLDSGPLFPDLEAGSGRMRKAGGQRELDLSEASVAQPRLDLERVEPPLSSGLPAFTPMAPVERFGQEPGRARSRPATEPESKPARKVASGGAPEASSKSTRKDASPAPKPAQAVTPPGPSKLVGVRQLLIGISVFVAGLILDDSVLRGDATPLSVALHGAGCYQLGLGVRRLFS